MSHGEKICACYVCGFLEQESLPPEFVHPSFFGKTQPNQHLQCQSNFCLDVHIDLKNQMHETSKCCYYLEYMYFWLMVNLIDKLQSDNNDDFKIF